MVTLADQIFLSLGLPLDARLTNVFIEGSTITVETREEYLIRVDIDSRYIGMEVFFIPYPGIYTIVEFMNNIQTGLFSSVTYEFKASTSDNDFVESSGGSSHIIKDEDGLIFPNRPNLTFKNCVIDDDVSENSTNVTPSVTEDITSFGVGNVGGVGEGDTIPTGTSINDLFRLIFQTKVSPTQPVVSLSISPGSTQEVGALVDFVITPQFTKNDAGNLNQVVIKKGSTTLVIQASLDPFYHDNQTITLGSNQYIVEISYDEGLPDPQKDGVIPAGTKSQSRSVTGSYRNWFGPNGSTDPADGDDIRNLSYSYNNTFTLNTGSTDTKHVIAIPSTKTLVSVIDSDALNADLVGSYIQSGTITTVPDGGGNSVNYKVYILTLATPYASNHKHNVTIS